MKWPTIHLSVTKLLEGIGTKISWEESMKLGKKKSLFRGLHMHVTWDIGTDWIFAVPDFKITILKPVTFSLTEDVKLGFGTNKWRKNSSYEKDRTLRERSLHRQEIESRNANSSNLSRKFLWECKSHIPTKDLEHN